MPKSSQAVAQALAGVAPGPVMWEPGLQQPAFDPVMLLAGLAGPGLLRGLSGLAGGLAKTAPKMMANEAGAIFPEGALPEGFTKAEMLTPAEQAYKVNELNEQLYLHNHDFKNALKAKWAMLKNTGGN